MTTPVLVYIRKSSESGEQQEDSIPRQREELAKFCDKQNYQIVREYVDEASGSKNQDKRVNFNRMLIAITSGEFEAKRLVCWNRNRFGRLDSIDGAFAAQILRKNGVILETIRDGEFDFTKSQDRMKDMFFAEAGNQMSKSLSIDALSGRMRALRQGYWPNGAVPYGYDRLYVSADGTKTTIPRSVVTTRPKGSKLKLVINPAEAAVVRELFADFVAKDVSLRMLATRLSAKGTPAPNTVQKRALRNQTGNHGWNVDTVKNILKIKAYTGVSSIGTGRHRAKEAFNRAEPTELAGACPVIVDADTFLKAQAKFARRTTEKRKPRPDSAGILSGFVYCGHCQFRLKVRRMKGHTYYKCESGLKRPHFGCRQWSIREEDLSNHVAAFVAKSVDEQVLLMNQARPDTNVSQLDVIESEAKRRRESIKIGTRNILKLTSTSLVLELEKQIIQEKSELDELDRRIAMEKAFKASPQRDSYVEWWQANRDKLVPFLMNSHKLDKLKDLEGDLAGVYVIPIEPEVYRGILDTLRVRATVLWDRDSGYFPKVKDIVVQGGDDKEPSAGPY